jgi:hypothetical protein
MPILSPVLERLGWRTADLISPHPPDDCRERLEGAISSLWNDRKPAGGTIRADSAALFWKDDRWTGFRGAPLIMGQPVLSVRWTPQGVGSRLTCRSGVSWVVLWFWAVWVGGISGWIVLFGGVSAGDFAGLGEFIGLTTAIVLVLVFLGHSQAGSAEDELVRYVTEVTDAEPLNE